MSTVLLVIHIMVAFAMIFLILMQRSEGGALGMGGGGGVVTSRGAANLLTRTTAILAAVFFLTSLGLGILGGHRKEGSAVDGGAQTPVSAPLNNQPGAPKEQTPPNAEKAPANLPQLKLPLNKPKQTAPQVPQSQ